MENLRAPGGEREDSNENGVTDEAETRENFDRAEAEQAVVKRKEEINNQETADPDVLLAKVEELRTAEIPEGKFRLPAECYDEVVDLIQHANETSFPEQRKQNLERAEAKLRRLERFEGKVDEAVGEKLWSLYSDPDISVGIYGTIAETDSDFGSENSPVFSDGIACADDMRRNIQFQDRKGFHAGGMSFLDLLDYGYPATQMRQPLTTEKIVEHSEDVDLGTHVQRMSRRERLEVPASQYTVVVAIPKNYETDDPTLRGEKAEFKNNHPYGERTKHGRTIRPEFIVGIVPSDANEAVFNPDFDAERVRKLNRSREAEMQEAAARRAEEEARQAETAEQAAQAKSSKSGLGRLFDRFRKHN